MCRQIPNSIDQFDQMSQQYYCIDTNYLSSFFSLRIFLLIVIAHIFSSIIYTPFIVNITSWSGNTTFRGYQLTVFDANSVAVGTFGEKERTICEGAAATHSEGSDKLTAEVEWIPPTNSSGMTYFVW